MKTKKNLLASMLITALLLTSIGVAQEKEDKSYGMAEITFMLPKIGMENAFVKAVAAHNNLYHKEGPYHAYLDNVLTSKEAGWYVWIMGPCTFTDLDSRPGEGAHTDHWNKNISPLVQRYGRTEYWRLNDKFSYSSGDTPPKYENIWFVDLKRGDYYRFKALMTKIKAAYVKKGEGNLNVYDTQFNANDGRDVALVWGLKNWAELDDDDEGIKKEYEEINGEGSWDNAMDEWSEITVSIKSQVWEHDVN